ncbi:hypothetical protein PAJ_p0280 (plasmid) [Pantoea ananatis AJ13355]|uniref:Secreted protein n=1 Tax=Pantoea ananatis (strain AJ13355) TaxID=932677 RepID=A0A0H3L457_PANAA|nr:hypothetical protein PAJ_p0280 [Pantoea ananatis AJ13355]
MPCMVVTTLRMMSPPRPAFADASVASWLAWCAFSAFCLTVEVNSSILAAVCTTAADCCSVRDDKSILPAAISEEARATLFTPSRTLVMMFCRLSFITLTACINWPSSSRRVVESVAVRSPSEMR